MNGNIQIIVDAIANWRVSYSLSLPKSCINNQTVRFFFTDVNWNRASGSATDSSWKKAYCSPPTLGFLPTRDGANKRDRDRRIERPRELISRRPSEPVKLISPDPPTEDIENSSVAVVKTEETIADDVRPSSSAIDADEVENFSDFSDDVDEILNRDLQVSIFRRCFLRKNWINWLKHFSSTGTRI